MSEVTSEKGVAGGGYSRPPVGDVRLSRRAVAAEFLAVRHPSVVIAVFMAGPIGVAIAVLFRIRVEDENVMLALLIMAFWVAAAVCLMVHLSASALLAGVWSRTVSADSISPELLAALVAGPEFFRGGYPANQLDVRTRRMLGVVSRMGGDAADAARSRCVPGMNRRSIWADPTDPVRWLDFWAGSGRSAGWCLSLLEETDDTSSHLGVVVDGLIGRDAPGTSVREAIEVAVSAPPARLEQVSDGIWKMRRIVSGEHLARLSLRMLTSDRLGPEVLGILYGLSASRRLLTGDACLRLADRLEGMSADEQLYISQLTSGGWSGSVDELLELLEGF